MNDPALDIAPDMYATTSEAAHILGITASTLRRWSRQGHITHLTDHNGWRLYRGSDLYTLRDALHANHEKPQ